MIGNFALIGGTGFETLPPEIHAEEILVETRYGTARLLSVSDNYVEPQKLYFLSRHGASHGLAPHQIGYRANIAALVELGVTHALATNAVGSLRRDLLPGSLVLFDDFLDFTRQRGLTYYEDNNWHHTPFAEPYSEEIRAAVIETAQANGIALVPKGCYVCCDGPRFETPAEVRLFAQWGGDVVGMTGLPEAIFAKEAGIQYAGLGIITNLGTGLSETGFSHENVVEVMGDWVDLARSLTMESLKHLRPIK